MAIRRTNRERIQVPLGRLLLWAFVAWVAVFTRIDTLDALGANASDIDSTEYRIAPGDHVRVVVFDHEQLSGEFIVDGGGQILLPIAGKVKLVSLTVAEAEQVIRERLSDGVLVQPAVSVRIDEYRPIAVTGYVRAPGSYPFRFGQTVKAAIAAAGGQGQPSDQRTDVTLAEFLAVEERMRVLEVKRLSLLMRKPRLEAQRDGLAEFMIPQLVGFDAANADLGNVYQAENSAFTSVNETRRSQLNVLHRQRPRIEAEIQAVTNQLEKEERRLAIVSKRVADLEQYRIKGLVRSSELNFEQREEARVDAEVARSRAALVRLERDLGDLDIKTQEIEANYRRQVTTELQEALQQLREVEASLGPVHELREIKALHAGGIENVEPDYKVLISRSGEDGIVTFDATVDTMLQPGDVVEVKRKLAKVKGRELPDPSTPISQSLKATSDAMADIQPSPE